MSKEPHDLCDEQEAYRASIARRSLPELCENSETCRPTRLEDDKTPRVMGMAELKEINRYFWNNKASYYPHKFQARLYKDLPKPLSVDIDAKSLLMDVIELKQLSCIDYIIHGEGLAPSKAKD
ncbi:hypothetical protein RRG08_014188 [Elysia crispata]|uniref:Uncharacterized protein n=1 Tax=Elysia crispata TaxID=231223 RepID=A0AAE0Z3X1_9GAST|nr:hypothetical protein RRG08_014188 [Elysia crispata]